MLTSSLTVNANPSIAVFSESEKTQIYSAALEVLEHTGVEIQHEKALNILDQAGARIDKKVAHIPRHLVQKAVETAPDTILVYDRNGDLAMKLGKRNTYFGTGSDTPNTLDLDGNVRKSKREDIGKVGRIVDAMENLDFIMSLGLISDKPMHVTDLYQFQEMLFNTVKPIVFTSHDRRGNKDILEMASIAVGGEDNLKEKPFIINYIEPSSPLRHSKEAADKLLFSAEQNMPLIYTPCTSGGGTAPVTLAGNIVLAMAESLSGITLSQLINEGTPVITGGICSLLDMKTSSYLYGSPEFDLMNAGLSEMSQFLDLPMYGTAGCSDSKVVDEQAAIEGAFSIATQSLAGANLTHDVGYIASGMVGSCEMIVMSNEIIGMVKRIMRGIDTSENRLAIDLIDKVGPRGSFLREKHTMENFKREQWRPQLLDRQNFEGWKQDGEKTMGDRIKERTEKILNEYEPQQLSQKQKTDILALIEEEEKIREVRY